jgi:hypothetical protein
LKRTSALLATGAVAGCIADDNDAGAGDGADDTDDGTRTDSTDDGGATDGTDDGEATDDADDGGATDGTDDAETSDGTDDGEASDDTQTDDTDDGGATDDSVPERQSQSIETGGTECGSENTATIAFDEEAESVTLQGTIATPDPCHVATIERASVDDESLAFVVVIGSESDDSGVCTQCLGQVDYTASFQFDDGLPDSVEVNHATGDGTTTVATKSR